MILKFFKGYLFYFIFFSVLSANIYFFNFKLLLLFYFTILYWFCHTSTCIHHGCTCVPHPEPPSHLPPHTIPLDHSSGGAPDSMQGTVNLEKIFESPLDCKEIKPVDPEGNQPWMNIHWKYCCWSWSSRTLAAWCEEPTHWKRSWYWG